MDTVESNGYASFCIWRNATHICSQAKIWLGNDEWILNDNYPQDVRRSQTPHVLHIDTNRRSDLGGFTQRTECKGVWRVDCHERSRRDERWVCIDAPDGRPGRQLQLIASRDAWDDQGLKFTA